MADAAKDKAKNMAFVQCDAAERGIELLRGIAQYMQERRSFALVRIGKDEVPRGFPFHDINCSGIIMDIDPRPCADQLKSLQLPLVDLTGEMEDDPSFTSESPKTEYAGRKAIDRADPTPCVRGGRRTRRRGPRRRRRRQLPCRRKARRGRSPTAGRRSPASRG